MRSLVVAAIVCLVLPAHRAAAQEDGPIHAAVAIAFSDATALPAVDPQSPAPRQLAFEYSEGYKTRAKIHRYASFATLPLFATEYWLGQSTYNNLSDGKKNAHVAVGTAIVGLYAAQAVTGVWNLVEARKDPHGRGKRMAHSILMLASGAGFAITPMLAPGEHEGFRSLSSFNDQRQLHRTMALTSIGIGTAGYLIMLFGGK